MSRTAWGQGSVYLRGRTYWLRYPYNGREKRESSHSGDKDKAERLLHKRLDDITEGRVLIDASKRKTTINNLLDGLERDYEMRGRRSLHNMKFVLKRVRDRFGEMRALHLTADDLRDYVVSRQREGAAAATISREMVHLHTAFQIALDTDRIAKIPKFPSITVHNTRDVLISVGDAGRLLAAMPDWLRDATEFELRTGWRGIEMQNLRWSDVLWTSGVIRLRDEHSKNNEARDFPLVGVVRDIIERRKALRIPACPFVFHRNGKQLSSSFRVHFKRAAASVGLANIRPHDCRRAFVTNAINQGIDSGIVKKLSGHKSDMIFRRYHIIKTADLARAVEQLDGYMEAHATDSKVATLQNPAKPKFAQLPHTGTDDE